MVDLLFLPMPKGRGLYGGFVMKHSTNLTLNQMLNELRQLSISYLGSQLGTFTTPSGKSIPAIAVMNEPPNTYTVNGVEVFITVDVVFKTNKVSFHIEETSSNLVVYFINHNANASIVSHIQGFIKHVRLNSSYAEISDSIYTPRSSLGNEEQIKFFVPFVEQLPLLFQY